MLATLRNAFKTGNATVAYPAVEPGLPYGYRGKPEHDVKQCIACGACAEVCPANAIQMSVDLAADTITWQINYGRCIFCGRCQENCPIDAIKLGKEFELAVMDADDLVEKASYTLEHCEACGKPFAPHKEVAYMQEVLEHVGGPESEEAKLMAHLCPACKRKRDGMVAAEREKGGEN